MMPVLYTDTSESWKLTRRADRFAIASAGIVLLMGGGLSAAAGPMQWLSGALVLLATLLWAVGAWWLRQRAAFRSAATGLGLQMLIGALVLGGLGLWHDDWKALQLGELSMQGWLWLAYLVLALWLSPAQIGWLIAASIPVGWWACTVTAKHMRVADPGHIVWDEVVAMWIVLWLCMPMGFWGQLIAFALFRYFDITKPQPARYFDEHVKNGFGVMADDLVAAGYTLLALALLKVVLA